MPTSTESGMIIVYFGIDGRRDLTSQQLEAVKRAIAERQQQLAQYFLEDGISRNIAPVCQQSIAGFNCKLLLRLKVLPRKHNIKTYMPKDVADLMHRYMYCMSKLS